ncbi:unnamed protein product [Trichobilharzia regenti]|nr:unnamed protein product [Trichobilharzia regenti]
MLQQIIGEVKVQQNGLDAMNLSSYKEHVELACQEAKEEIKGRKMLSASYRFKHQDSEELERLAKEQQEIFEQVCYHILQFS